MSNALRKIKRNRLKKHLNSNKIKDFWHSENDPLWKRLQNGMREVKREAKK